ncbi:MAG: ABC transporter permease [Flavobacteriales bacterium]|nr:ABC transporter permease [Flavobacteriales bacterium]
MPLFLIVTMAIIMDAPFKDYQDVGVELLIVNEDNDTLGNIIERGLKKSDVFTVIKNINGKELTRKSIESLIKKGDYMIGIVIPKGATNDVNEQVNELVSSMLHQFGMELEQNNKPKKIGEVKIQVYLDPAIKQSFANTVISSIKSFTSQVESKLILDGFYVQMTEEPTMNSQKPQAGFIQFEEIYPSGAVDKSEKIFTNSVQHNVPAWTVFAMFLTVAPLASNMIKEREGGSMLRLMVAPGSYLTLLTGKLLFYVGICMIQFVLMMLVGIYLLPFVNLPSLVIGNSFFGILLVALMVSFAATGFGVLVGTVFTSYQQASIFGTVIDVIMAAVGGIMVPLFAMPDVMKTIGRLTPLNWGMESFNDLFLRSAGITEILPEVFQLFSFAVATLILAWWLNRKNMVV